MNLVQHEWIPVRRQDGRTEKIAPWQLTSGIESNPIVAVDFPRADLSSATVMFLIGVLQAAMTPDRPGDWERMYKTPPEPEALRDRLGSLIDFFNFDGDGPRCFQDSALADEKPRPVSALLIDEPGDQTRKQNRDLFIKREQFPGLGLSAAIAVLINMQTSAPGGGQGHRTSMRGGGPLNTLLVPDPVNDELPANLWRTIWLNVLTGDRASGLTGNPDLHSPEARFPWMGATRTSEPGTGRGTTPQDAHPLQMYFGMPRRIWLDLDGLDEGICPLTLNREPIVTTFRTRNYGVNYEGPWEHPFSPHRVDADGLPIPLHPQPGGIGYRHWLNLTMGKGDGRSRDSIRAARVVHAGSDSRKRDRNVLVWAFGYDMDNMKSRGWYESTLPVYHLGQEQSAALALHAEGLIEAAGEIAGNLRQAVRKAWFSERASPGGDLNFITQSFWQRTEPAFYQALHREYESLSASAPEPDRSRWHATLHGKAIELFDLHAASGDLAFENPKRIALARRELIRFNFKNSILARLGISRRAA